MLSLLKSALEAATADYLELRAEFGTRTRIESINGEVQFVHSDIHGGTGVRVLVRGAWGRAAVTNLEDLDKAIQEAQTAARVSGGGKVRLAPISNVCETVPRPAVRRPPDRVPLEEKVVLVEACAKILQMARYPRQQTRVTYQDMTIDRYVVTSEGTAIVEPRLLAVMEIEVFASGDNGVCQAMEYIGGSADFEDLAVAPEAAERCLSRVGRMAHADSISPGIYDVVCDPALTGLLAHEIVGHMLEADVTAGDAQLMLRLRRATPIAWEGLCLVDDPTAEGEGRYVYDDEGTRGRRVSLIQHGRVTGHLHSRATAAAFGVEPTGHARACGYDVAPLVRMSNTFVLPADDDPEDLIGSIQKGIYACGTRGATGGRYFALQPQEAYLIENGRITKPIRGVRLYGDAFECLRRIDGIGRDFGLFSGGCGGCYKGGQGPLRTSSGGPHMRLRGMMVK